MQVFLKLNSGLGNDLGPNFALTANTGSVVPSSLNTENLLAGTYVTINDSATYIDVTSLGICTNKLRLYISGIPAVAAVTAVPNQLVTSTCASRSTSIGNGAMLVAPLRWNATEVAPVAKAVLGGQN